MAPPRLRLRRSLSRAIRAGHPWIYREAIDGRVPGPGAEVAVVDGRGRTLGRGLTESGPIGVRLWTNDDTAVDDRLLGARFDAAIELRRRIVPKKTDVFRLVHGEGDRMPGIVVDVYGRHAVLALDGETTQGRHDWILDALRPRLADLGVATILGRWGRRGERTVEVLHGPRPPKIVEVTERGMTLGVDLLQGQKTGMFIDQRHSRSQVRALAKGRRVLDLYAYIGGFSAAAGRGGARHVTTVDLAAPAIALARRNWSANGLPADRQTAIARDVPELLDELAGEDARFDLIVADPPSFAPAAAAVDKALSAYERLHRACLDRLAPGGLLVAASCSSHVGREAFENALARAAGARVLQVVDRWGPPPDHPRLLAFPEGDYLTVTLARVVS